jgi:hypothetical protein
MGRSTAKLVFAAARGKPRFKISSADWKRIEAAYGHLLSNTLRRKIRTLTRECLDWAQFERTAESNADARTRVQKIKKGGTRISRQHPQVPCEDGKGDRLLRTTPDL